MWVSELDVRGFKHLSGQWPLEPGLTIVTGPNESGKSTFHEILIRALFGFSKSERRKDYRKGGSSKDRRRPWNGAPFAVNAILEDVGGRRLRIEWDFEQHQIKLLDADTGKDLSAQVRGKRDEVNLGRFLLDIGLEEYTEVCCLRQEAICAVKHSEELTLALRRSIESGTKDTGVEEADARLAAYLRERLERARRSLRRPAERDASPRPEPSSRLHAKRWLPPRTSGRSWRGGPWSWSGFTLSALK